MKNRISFGVISNKSKEKARKTIFNSVHETRKIGFWFHVLDKNVNEKNEMLVSEKAKYVCS